MGKSKLQNGSKPSGVIGTAKATKGKVEEVSKKAAKSVVPEGKKKKAQKEPSPEPVVESESEEDSEDASEDEDESSEKSESSESESEAEKPAAAANTSKKVNGTAEKKVNGNTNGTAKPTTKPDQMEVDTSESSESSDDEAAPAKFQPDSEADDSDVESEEDESEDDGEPNTAKAATKVTAPKATKSSAVKKDESDESEEDESEEDASESSESSEESNAEAQPKKPEPTPKKRKAEDDATPASAKQTKTEGDVKNLWIGQLSWNVDDEWLADEFRKIGEIVSARVITDRDSGRSKGFGYVEYVTVADAQRAYDELQGHEIDGRGIRLDFAAKRSNDSGAGRQDRSKAYGDQRSPPSDTLFLANLAFSATQDMISEQLSSFGTILGVRLPTDPDSGAPKGFGYVQFGSVEEATAAINGAAGMEIDGRRPRLDFSSPRGEGGGRGGGRGGGGFGGRGRGGGDRGGFGGRGGRGGRGGFGDRGGRGGRGGFEGRGGSTNRGGFGDFKGKKMTF